MIVTMHSAALLVLLLQQGNPNVRHDRMRFFQELHQVRDGWTKAEVKRQLGSPDDTFSAMEAQGNEVWRYGTNGHRTIATLGELTFKHGRVIMQSEYVYRRPPPLSLISDHELFTHLRVVDRAQRGQPAGDDPLFLIQVVNDLRPLGKEKALAVLLEFDRLASPMRRPNSLYWLVRVLFTPKSPPGYFRIPAIGGIDPAPPTDLTKWPDFPVINADDVPFVCPTGIKIGGLPEPFDSYVRDQQANWTMRTRPIRPPDDPFLAYEKALKSKEWKIATARPDSPPGGKGALHREVLLLVRNAWRSSALDDSSGWSGVAPDFDTAHKTYLATGGHWSEAKQTYVRGDDTLDVDDDTDDEQSFTFPKIPNLNVSFSYERDGRNRLTFATYFWMPKGGSPQSFDVLIADGDSGRALYHATLHTDASLTDPEVAIDNIEVLAGHTVKFTVKSGGKKYESPVFTP